jgi:hypothetical protein
MGRMKTPFPAAAGFGKRVLASFAALQADDQRRLAQGLAPKTRRRRRTTITDLVGAAANDPRPLSA